MKAPGGTLSRRPVARALGVAALLLALLAALPAAAPAVVVDGIAAVVNGEIITLLELEKAGRAALAERLRAAGPGEVDRVRREVLRASLDQLVLVRLQGQRARQLGIGVSAQETDAAIASIMEDNHLTADMLERLLAERGITQEQYRREIQEQIRLSKLVQVEIRTRVTVSEEEVAAYYGEHRADWFRPEKVRVRHLLLPLAPDAPPGAVEEARRRSAAILAEARAGADFAALIRTHAPGSAPGDGDPVSGELARGEFLPALEEAAFTLPAGAVSEPVQSPAGFHLIQVVSRTPAVEPALADVRDSIEQKLADQKTRARFDAWQKKLREDALVDIRF